MPAEFLACIANGGHVITIDLPENKYMHVCYIHGKKYAGEVKTKKSVKRLKK